MKTRRQAIKEANEYAREALATRQVSGDHLGDLAFWSLNQGFRMSCVLVQEALRRHNLDPDTILPETTDYVTSFGRSVEIMRSSVRSMGYTLLEADKGPHGERRVAVVKIARGHTVTTQDEGTVACPNTGAVPYVERDDPTGIAGQVVRKAMDLYQVYTADDIRSAITTLFARWAAMPCRERPSVVYFVPPGGSQEVEQLNAAMQEVDAGEISQFAGYASDARSVKACTRAVNEGLEARLNEFAKNAEAFTSNAKVRPSTIEKTIEETKNLKKTAELYRVILGSAVLSIDAQVEKIEATLRESLGIAENRAS